MTSLTPTEQATVDRFGIHDEDIINQLVGDDTPACQVSACGATASHVLVCPHCNRQCGLCCTPHTERIRLSTVIVQHEQCGEVMFTCDIKAVKL